MDWNLHAAMLSRNKKAAKAASNPAVCATSKWSIDQPINRGSKAPPTPPEAIIMLGVDSSVPGSILLEKTKAMEKIPDINSPSSRITMKAAIRLSVNGKSVSSNKVSKQLLRMYTR
ncbi:hypothetical protein D3C75_1087450 [compost metagenome]